MIEIDREHVSFQRQKQTLQMYRDLYAGGNLFKERVAHYLLRRQKEPLDVYAERLSRVFYENYIGSIIDWYGSTLFRREPSLSDFLRQSFIDALVAGKSHILIDFPRTSKQPANRAEEDAAGISRAYLVRYQAEDLINWCVDERGDYEWLVFRQKCKQQATIESSSVVEETWWRYYDKSEYRLYRRID